jgi:hypothetical protein
MEMKLRRLMYIIIIAYLLSETTEKSIKIQTHF